MILLTKATIDIESVLASVRTTSAGAVVLFLGTTREMTANRRTTRLAYEAHESLAVTELNRLASEARHRWPDLLAISIQHRLGVVDLGEVSIAIGVSAPHRESAFEAGKWLIDRAKESVPIWKQEHWEDGTQEWIHPLPETGAAS